jgi:hypothetical protein
MVSILFNKSKKNSSNIFKIIRLTTGLIFLFLFSLGLSGCGNQSSSDNSSDLDNLINQGVFLDSSVQGLHYETETHSGMTDENGSFQYRDGEMIMFSMGGIFLGEALADVIMTPIHMVPEATDETHPTVTNMLRFMQTLDLDNNPENGITLPPHILDELEGRPIHFDMNTSDFEHHIDMQMFMDTIHEIDENYDGRMMVSIEDAQEHMRNTMNGMMNDGIPGQDGVTDGGVPGGGGMMNDGIPGQDGVTDGGMPGGGGMM